ncbi:MAG: acyl-CoA ligase (AMP-forming), exosortase A system-associated [Kangiellaceae bacterium]|nr:acyl-CoA ligase (AMP-forming), exosortase A system-associated [Kangiellaceae bacterium]
MPALFHQLISDSTEQFPENIAIEYKNIQINYREIDQLINNSAAELLNSDARPSLNRAERVAIYLPKQPEAVIAMFATSKANGTFVPINPLLKPAQVNYILDNCDVSVLITSLSRYKQLKAALGELDTLKRIIITNCTPDKCPAECQLWEELISNQDMLRTSFSNPKLESTSETGLKSTAAILYTSGSTGQPKGVVLSDSNLIEGAKSVASYLNNHQGDRLLAVLPFSFDYGLSQLTTGFLIGARVVLIEYLLPVDVINAVVQYRITGLAAVPPLWLQLVELEWPKQAVDSLRYITNSGGAMPTATLSQLRTKLPLTKPYLMYGLTESFRSTYLEPEELDTRPTSMGKAIPNATILVLNNKGQLCGPGEQGELVHVGVHVAKGYWQDSQKTSKKFRRLPPHLRSQYGDAAAVWSGDIVTSDEQGFLYFVGRNDDMIKSSGYRISPAELEEVVYQHGSLKEVAAIGIPHQRLGHLILLIVVPNNLASFNPQSLTKHLKKSMPNFMQPHAIELENSLPRNSNGKINRNLLSDRFKHLSE